MAKGICDRCGFEYALSALRKEWNGLRVCNPCWEPRHPQEFVRGKADRQVVRNARPEPEPILTGFDAILDDDGNLISDHIEIPLHGVL